MVTCSIASALCHYLTERKAPRVQTDADLLASTSVRSLMLEVAPVPANLHLEPLMAQLLEAESGTLPVLGSDGKVYGTVQVEQMRDVWKDPSLHAMLVASDLARKLPVLSAANDLTHALHVLDHEDVDALPVEGGPESSTCGLITRASIRRLLAAHHARQHARGEPIVAPTETNLVG
jgi:CIC family chloride channel protein